MKRILCVLTGMFAAALLVGASPAIAKPDCGLNTGKAATGKPIPVGGVTSMSGIGSFKEADDAARAYFDCVNANGGIHGRPITYHDEDDQSKLDVAAQAAKKLVGDEGVYIMVGSTSFIECIANADYYIKQNILEVGLGIPSQCFKSKNIAEINAGPLQSGVGGADYARRNLKAKKLVCWIFKLPGADYICGGIENWGKHFGVNVTSIYSDPSSLDVQSLVLQYAATGADSLMVFGTDDIGAQILGAAQGQDLAAKMNFTVPTSYYTVRLPGAIDSKYWNNRLWVNSELAPMDSKGKDNLNWHAVMDAYGPKILKDSFSQAGYIAARIVVGAMLTIKDPAKVNRNTVTAAVQKVVYPTDILCQSWYWGGPGATEHNANHVTRTVTVENGKWKNIEGCRDTDDPSIESIRVLEKKLGVKIQDKAILN